MKKIVNGALVAMTAAEIAERQAEEAAWTPRPRPKSADLLLADVLAEVKTLQEDVRQLKARNERP
jgi:hypothetical protein